VGEGLEAILGLLDRLENIDPDPDATPPQYLGHMPRSHQPINVTMTAREPAAV